ncbi:MAG: hypothetical protein MHMPM18_004975 [Marteilia pararefringens]
MTAPKRDNSILLEEKLKRNGVKRPRNAFIIFSSKIRAQVTLLNRGNTVGEISTK